MGSLIMCTLCKVRMLPPCAPDMQVVRRHLKEMGYGFATCLHLHVYTCKYVYVFFMNWDYWRVLKGSPLFSYQCTMTGLGHSGHAKLLSTSASQPCLGPSLADDRTASRVGGWRRVQQHGAKSEDELALPFPPHLQEPATTAAHKEAFGIDRRCSQQMPQDGEPLCWLRQLQGAADVRGGGSSLPDAEPWHLQYLPQKVPGKGRFSQCTRLVVVMLHSACLQPPTQHGFPRCGGELFFFHSMSCRCFVILDLCSRDVGFATRPGYLQGSRICSAPIETQAARSRIWFCEPTSQEKEGQDAGAQEETQIHAEGCRKGQPVSRPWETGVCHFMGQRACDTRTHVMDWEKG